MSTAMNETAHRLHSKAQAPRRSAKPSHDGMIFVKAGDFDMGSDRHYPEEAPVHRVHVDGFWMDATPVTNSQFEEFVAATDYVTFAEVAPDAKDYPGALPEMLRPASMVFVQPSHAVDLRDWREWWTFMFDADWRHPYGPGTSIDGLDDHPVVHVAYQDVLAFAEWSGKSLPTEAEWEFAARGGFEHQEFAWGEHFMPDGECMANTWQGDFPIANNMTDGYTRTSPVTAFPPNGYGFYDMIGNVWEWTTDWYSRRHSVPPKTGAMKSCCVPRNPRGGGEHESYDTCEGAIRIPRKVLKGGSFLCAPNYCRRYRPAARHAQPIDTSACHVGFRCIVRGDA